MFSPNKDEFINKYEELKSSRAMGEYYNVDKTTILNYAKKIGYDAKKHRNDIKILTDEQIAYIIENYNKKPSSVLAKELGVSKSLIKKTWTENGLRGKIRRTYYVNDNYFENIDSKDKAYILGVIASDGCVYQRDNHVGMLAFKFHIQEKDIIDIILKYMNSNYKPYITEDRIGLQINSDKICNDLSKYNIVSKKTWIYEPTMLKEDLMSHFIRGYFDGDGSIGKNSKFDRCCDYTLSFCGNKNTMFFISNFLVSKGIENKVKQDKREKYTEDFYCIRIKKNKSKYDLINLMYKDCEDIKLNRKYEKCIEFKIKYENAYLFSNE